MREMAIARTLARGGLSTLVGAVVLALSRAAAAQSAGGAWDERLASSLSGSLTEGHVALSLGAAWLGGLLTALTPCVYPLIPITIRYFGGVDPPRRGRVVGLASLYVAGMVLLYASLGTLFGAFNVVFGSFLASPWVIGVIAAYCIAMGLSMLGLFTIQLPSGLSTRLSQVGGQTPTGAFTMGLVSGLIAAPCTGPVLSVILALIAGSGEVGIGFALMAAFALGLGLPFMLIAVFSGSLRKLPHGGPWMEIVKLVLATAMFVVAIYFLQTAWPRLGALLAAAPRAGAVGGMLIVLGVLSAGLYLKVRGALGQRAWKALGVLSLTAGAAVVALGGPGGHEAQAGSAGITWVSSHDEGIAKARGAGLPVMIDFTAEWCAACKELEHKTFVDAAVQREAARFVPMRLDATAPDDAMDELFQRYGVLGLPTVVFIDSTGKLLDKPRVTGFVEAPRFLELMRQVH